MLTLFFCSTLVCAQTSYLGETIPCDQVELGCVILGSAISGEHVIRNNAEYQELIQERSPHPNCGFYELPSIDFSEYTLIGYVSSIGGCKTPEISHEIKRINNDYRVNIDIIQYGRCKRGNPIKLWCLVPKIDENATVEFAVDSTVREN